LAVGQTIAQTDSRAIGTHTTAEQLR